MFFYMKRKATRAANFMQLSTLISIPQRSHSYIQQDFAQLDSYFFSALLLILFACLFGFNENAYHICTIHIIRAITRWYNKFKSFHLNFYIRVHTKICVFFCSLEFWSHIKFKAMQTAHRKCVYMSRIFFLDLKCRWFSLIKKKEKEMPLWSSGWMHCICKRRYLSMKLIEYGILLMRDQCRHST